MQKGSYTDYMGIAATFFILAVMAATFIMMFTVMGDASVFAPVAGFFVTMQIMFINLGVGLLFFLFGSIIVAAALAARVGASPALIVIGILMLPVVIIFVAGLSMGWTAVATAGGGLGAAAARIPLMDIVMNNFVLIALLAVAVIMVATYAGYRAGWFGG